MSAEYLLDLNKKLNAACTAGDLAQAKELVLQGAEINNAADSDPALIAASSKGHVAVVEWLLDNGANPNVINSKRSTSLMCAAFHGQVECIRLLLRHGADVSPANNAGKTAMEYAAGKDEALRALQIRPEEVSTTWALDNRVMQEIFDFRRLERVTLVRKSEGGEVEAMQRDAFSQLPDDGALQKAFDEHRRRGGKRSEEEVFNTGLGKLKMNIPRKGI